MDKKITFRLTENSYQLLKHICNVKGITITDLIHEALQYYIWKRGEEKPIYKDWKTDEFNDLPFN